MKHVVPSFSRIDSPLVLAGRYRQVVAGLALSLPAVALLAGYGRLSAVAPQHVGHVPYCEALHGGAFAQPVNTISNLSYLVAGLLILFLVGRNGAAVQGEADTRQRHVVVSILGWVALGLGFGSAAFHGTLSHWGGLLDNIAMNLLVTLVFFHNLARLQGWRASRFALLHAGSNAATTALLWHDDSGSLALFAVLLTAALLSECMILAPAWFPWVRHRVRGRHPGCLGGAIGTFAVAWALWRLSDSGAALCSPGSALQGHAVWHLLTAVSVAFLYFYFRSEGTPVPMPRPAGWRRILLGHAPPLHAPRLAACATGVALAGGRLADES